MSLKDHLNEIIKYHEGKYCQKGLDETIVNITHALEKYASMGGRYITCFSTNLPKNGCSYTTIFVNYDKIYEKDIIEHFSNEGLDCSFGKDGKQPNVLYITIPK